MDDCVKKEILGREAIALGLDRNETVIRKRLRGRTDTLHADGRASVASHGWTTADARAKQARQIAASQQKGG